MNPSRRIILVVAIVGAAFCGYLLVGFVGVIANNGLSYQGSDPRDHYLAVGQAYSQGFSVGFFLCFCLALIAFLVGTWYEESLKRKASVRLTTTPERSPDPPAPATARRAAALPRA